jgi:dUTP pyrophosphatase
MKFEKISYTQFKKDNIDTMCGYEQIKLPQRATKSSAGYDIYSVKSFELKPRQSILLPTGIKVQVDSDKAFFIIPRSGQGFKYKVQLYNTIGLIDADYYNNEKNEGHIWVKLYNDSPDGETLKVEQGDSICQGVILKYYTIDNDCADGVRKGGFGSTTPKEDIND